MPASNDWYLLHPDWREGFADIERTILDQLQADRAAGARVQLDYGAPWVESASLTYDDLVEASRRKARSAIERAMRDRGDLTTAHRALEATVPPRSERGGVGAREGWAA
jgi:hypothetical protein